MTNLIQADIFFFVSTIGFIVIGIFLIILIILSIKTISSFLRILDRIENSLDTIGDTTRELLDDLRENVFFKMLFRPKRRSKNKLDK